MDYETNFLNHQIFSFKIYRILEYTCILEYRNVRKYYFVIPEELINVNIFHVLDLNMTWYRIS